MKLRTADNRSVRPWVAEHVLVAVVACVMNMKAARPAHPGVFPAGGAAEPALLYSSSAQDGSTALAAAVGAVSVRLHRRQLWLMGLARVNLTECNFPSVQVTKDIIRPHPPKPLQSNKPFFWSWGGGRSVQIYSFLEQEGILKWFLWRD